MLIDPNIIIKEPAIFSRTSLFKFKKIPMLVEVRASNINIEVKDKTKSKLSKKSFLGRRFEELTEFWFNVDR